MKTIIVGGVAGGASAAARLRRLDENAQILLLERGEFISFANCGLPYYAGGVIKEQEDLLLQSPDSFHKRFRIDVRVFSEVIGIDKDSKTITVKNHSTGETYIESYDKLILSPGAKPVIPRFNGVDNPNVFTLRNIPDTVAIMDYIRLHNAKSAVIVGGGFIGVEMAENLQDAGIETSIVEMQDHLMASLDFDMAAFVHNRIREKGVDLHLSNTVKEIINDGDETHVILSRGSLATDLVILAVGVKADTDFLINSGIRRNEQGGIIVNEQMLTSDPNIYAVGDAVEIVNFVSGQKAMIPLAGPANKQGRIAADNIYGIASKYEGTQGSSIIKVFDLTAASTGINEKQAIANGLNYEKSFTYSASHASYYPGGSSMTIKTIFDKTTGKILGAQIVGKDGVDKRCDVMAAAIRAGMTAHDLTNLEQCYAPPYNTAKDPVNFAGYVIENIMNGKVAIHHWHDVDALQQQDDALLLDVNTAEEFQNGHITGAINIPLDNLREHMHELDSSKRIFINCFSGLRSYIACRILSANGITCSNLSGGYQLYQAIKGGKTPPANSCYPKMPTTSTSVQSKKINSAQLLTTEQIKSVKGQGFLYNKGTRNFSGRVITENGILTDEQMSIVTQAARQFGNGNIALTVRLTLEIQGIPYEKIPEMVQFMEEHGLQIGGTGSKVRPIVACKGTTCSNGLCDTTSLGTIIHKRFYEGYRSVTLPHKIKIAIGGCPNNCVKPDLNDIGIVAIRTPKTIPDNCRGCKKCGVVDVCPISASAIKDNKITIDMDICNSCGKCIDKCYFDAMENTEVQYKVYVGGRWGKQIRHGSVLSKPVSEEEALDLIEKSILLFKKEGITGERFSDTIERLGMDYIDATLNSEKLLQEKSEILQIQTVGGAKF